MCRVNICQESLKKFREEAEKLEKSESLQKAREKYVRSLLLVLLSCILVDMFFYILYCWLRCPVWHVTYTLLILPLEMKLSVSYMIIILII